MQPIKTITGIAAVLRINNIDTDMIIPKQFLKTITRVGLGSKLFYEMRYKNNVLQEDFVLNKPEFKNAKFLLTGDNFGCGSSREHAPWALLDYGISCIIGESFADIFYNNCFENGILPIVLSKTEIDILCSANSEITVNLESKTIIQNGNIFVFEIDDFKRNCLLNGLDTIGLILKESDKILEFESKQKQEYPWI